MFEGGAGEHWLCSEESAVNHYETLSAADSTAEAMTLGCRSVGKCSPSTHKTCLSNYLKMLLLYLQTVQNKHRSDLAPALLCQPVTDAKIFIPGEGLAGHCLR